MTGSGETRRHLLLGGGAAGLLLLGGAGAPRGDVDLRLPGGPSRRRLTRAFPEKGEMILQRTRPPLLETPFEVYDQGVFTPNDRFFVRWHWADFPTEIDPARHRLRIHGAVERSLELSIEELLAMPAIDYAAVNQCAGNSRGLFEPRVGGAQWSHGAMGNARWTGVPLRAVLDRAGVKAGAVAVRFGGLDRPALPDAPRYLKSLSVDHALDGEVMIAWAQNGERLPLLNGFPLRLIVPGWYSTYWVKMLSDIEVLTAPDENFWMAKAYRLHVDPGVHGSDTKPVEAMVPRAVVTNLRDGARVKAGAPLAVRGLALGGDRGVARVDLSIDGGRQWQPAALGADEGRWSFRRFEARVPAPAAGPFGLLARCTNSAGVIQPLSQDWNKGGYLRGLAERVELVAA